MVLSYFPHDQKCWGRYSLALGEDMPLHFEINTNAWSYIPGLVWVTVFHDQASATSPYSSDRRTTPVRRQSRGANPNRMGSGQPLIGILIYCEG